MSRAALLTVLILVLAAVPVATAGPDRARVAIVHDLGPDRVAAVGVPVTLGWTYFNDTGQPDPHQDAVFEVVLEGETLLKTSPSSGHDYDGVDLYRVVFPRPGTFQVRASIIEAGGPLEGGETYNATLTGRVHASPLRNADVNLTLPDQIQAQDPVPIRYNLSGSSGTVLEATDARLRVRRLDNGMETLKLATHAADGEHVVDYAFPRTGTYEVLVQAHRDPSRAAPVRPAVARTTVEVADAAPSPPGSPSRGYGNLVDPGTASDGHDLFATYDPYTSVGQYNRMRLGSVAWDDAADGLARDVRIDAELTGPDGPVLSTSSLAAPSGVRVLEVSPHRIGDYTLDLAANGSDWGGTSQHLFSVHPPDYPAGAGPLFTGLEVDDEPRTGSTSRLTFGVDGAAGAPPIHTEVDFRIADGDTDRLVASGKLHAHYNATFPLDVRFDQGGDHVVDLRPTPTTASPTPAYYGQMLGEPPVFTLDVAGPDRTVPPSEAPGAEDEPAGAKTTPGPSLLVVAAASVGAAWLVRRRR